MGLNLSKNVVLDSSVIIKWFQAYEAMRDQAIMLRQAHLDNLITIYVPDLLVYEVANVLLHKHDMNQVKISQALESLFNIYIEVSQVTRESIKTVLEFACFYKITVYDATFIALAASLQADFITADEKLVQKVNNLNFVYNLSDIEF